MDSSTEIALLKKTLVRQKKARIQAEKLLEKKSQEFNDATHHLKQANSKLENLLLKKNAAFDGDFINIIDPYVVISLDFIVQNMNDSAKEFLGLDHNKETINFAKLVHEDYREYSIKSFRFLLELGILKNYRVKLVLKHNVKKHVQINCSLVYDSDKKPIGVQGIIRDIGHETEIEEQLKKQNKQLDIIVRNSPLGIALTVNGKFIRVNPSFAKLLGYSQNELKQLHVKDVSVKDTSEASLKLMEKVNAGIIDNFSVEKQYIRKNGTSLLAKTTVGSVKDDKGEVEYQVAVIEDITKEKKAEKQIITEREKYSNIIANMNLGLIEVDLNDVIQIANKSFFAMSGYSQEELQGRKAREVLNVQEIDLMVLKDKERLEGKSDSYEIQVVNKSGETRYWLISGAPRYNSEGELVGSVGIHLDITEQKHLELQKEKLLKDLEASNQGLQEYAHIVSHDLKSPLRSISALSTWLNEDYKDVLDENGVNNLQMIQEKIESMDKLIDGILKYSSISNDRLLNEPVDLNSVITEISEIIFIPEHVKVVTEKKLPTLYIDKTKIHQVFQNLIANAVMHITRKEGIVSVGSVETKTHWQFNVSDNGIGIPKEYHAKIFEIFQSIGDEERSTGIGLSIVKKIVTLYGGNIWLESEKDKGTTFYFTIKKNI